MWIWNKNLVKKNEQNQPIFNTPGAAPGYINTAPLGLKGSCLKIILNMAITWISWGAAPGYINTAPLGLKGSCLNYKSFSKSPFQAKVSLRETFA
jgi:hypothetical protein